ncbi:hypothetical protein COB11_01290 [Candidatus Aerophobetes bacterium]|uniref:Peptidase C45 n=1 Tax=Aerophobetes bacterium TaxID=2030807 RepID=A0A2A4YLJ5_UNCAE|nr:MAG: hypothetical protein COB11_01290 [Candidatus Aerophobetes bacterium]
MKYLILSAFFLITSLSFASIEDRCGDGYLEELNGRYILHVEGSAYSRGFQHGVLLKEKIQRNISRFIESDMFTQDHLKRVVFFKKNIPLLLEHTSSCIKDEIQGLSDGSGIDINKLYALNLFPELFHCTGIVVSDDATENKDLFHVRILDYRAGLGLQDTAVLMVSKPDDKFANLNVSYAGFIGCVTGMNEKGIALGEVGGLGYDYLDGVPMSFLMKEALENSKCINCAKKIFETNKRTGEYYYIVSDGKTNKACGVYATNSQIHFIEPGSKYTILAPKELPKHYKKDGADDKFFLTDYQADCKKGRASIYDAKGSLIANFFHQPANTLIVTGFFKPERYSEIYSDIQNSFGNINTLTLKKMLNAKTSSDSNLHNAIFYPKELKVWISHAKSENEPAYSQPYEVYNLQELLGK